MTIWLLIVQLIWVNISTVEPAWTCISKPQLLVHSSLLPVTHLGRVNISTVEPAWTWHMWVGLTCFFLQFSFLAFLLSVFSLHQVYLQYLPAIPLWVGRSLTWRWSSSEEKLWRARALQGYCEVQPRADQGREQHQESLHEAVHHEDQTWWCLDCDAGWWLVTGEHNYQYGFFGTYLCEKMVTINNSVCHFVWLRDASW